MKTTKNIRFRYNMITVFVYLIGIILLLQLFNLQIVHGQEYREQSNTRLTRESILEAARGDILDKSGNIIATTSMGFSLELYKTKSEATDLNNTILNMIHVLEENQDRYVDSFPISIDPFTFHFSSEENLLKWKEKNKIQKEATAEEAFYEFKEKYKIQSEDIIEIRKIIGIRYEIVQQGYSNTKPIEISSNISRNSALIFSEKSADFPGINVVTEPIRIYNEETLASHIVGYVGKISDKELETRKENYGLNDVIGKTGIEYAFEEYLKGQDGTKQIDMSVDGQVVEEYITKEATAGSDVILTIDANLQRITENALEVNIQKIASGGFSEQYNTNAGAAVVMNVNTGEILAMASYPTFNPQLFVNGISTTDWNNYQTEDKPLMNKAIQENYAPGSIFKMVTAIAGLESGTISTTDKIRDTGVYPKYTNPVCWIWTDYKRAHGWQNVSDAIKNSCNYFFYELGDRMGIDELEKYARYFGLGEKTGVELPGETSGVVASRTEKAARTNGEIWYPGETLSAAIGQSYNSFSPLQITKYISMVANGGKQISPSIVKNVIRSDGTEVSRSEIEKNIKDKLGITVYEKEDINMSEEHWKAVMEGMRSVTSETGGTAYSTFRNFGIEVGGKTGSAQAGNKTNAWFVGFAPFDNPEIAVVVLVENGGHGTYTAEVVREIIGEYFGMNSVQIVEDMSAGTSRETIR